MGKAIAKTVERFLEQRGAIGSHSICLHARGSRLRRYRRGHGGGVERRIGSLHFRQEEISPRIRGRPAVRMELYQDFLGSGFVEICLDSGKLTRGKKHAVRVRTPRGSYRSGGFQCGADGRNNMCQWPPSSFGLLMTRPYRYWDPDGDTDHDDDWANGGGDHGWWDCVRRFPWDPDC